MTSPEGGSGDDVIRVIYQAVADYAQLLRETRLAKAETAALKREIDGLAGTRATQVKVTADTGQAKAELARVFRDIAVTVKATVDAAQARAEAIRAFRDVTVKIKADLDATGLRERLQRAAGDARVKLVVDAAQARAEVARATRDIRLTATVDADTTRLKEQIARAVRDAQLRISVLLERTEVITKMRALITYLQAMGPVRLKVVVDDAVFDRLAAIEDRLERIRAGLGGAGGGGGGPPHPHPDEEEEPRPGPDPAKKAGKLPDGLTQAAGMIAGWGSLIAAAIPIAAGLAGAVGTVAAAFLAAGGAAAIFAVSAVGQLNRVTEAVKAYEKSGTLAEGPLGTVVSQFETLKARYNELLKDTERPVFAVFSRGLQIAMDLLRRVEPLIGTAATAIDGALGQIQGAVKGPVFGDFLSFVSEQGPHAIGQFTAGLLGFGAGLTRLIMQFAPFITTFVDGFARAGQAFQQWSSGLGSNPEFQRFLAYAIAEIPHVIEFLINLVTAAVKVGAALAPIGGMLLAVANAALKLVAALPPGVLTVILGGLLGLAAAIKAVQIAVAVSEGFAKFSAFLTGLPGMLGRAVAGMSAMRVAMIGLGAATAIGLVLGAVALAISALSAQTDKNAEADRRAADAADTHRRAVQSLTEALQANHGAIGPSERVSAYEELDKDQVALPDKYKDSQLVDKSKIKTVAGYAGEAGVNPNDLVNARLGDPKALAKTDDALAKLQLRYKQLADAAALLPKGDARHFDAAQYYAEADAIGNSRDQMHSYAGVMDEASAKYKILNQLTEESKTAAEQAGVAYGTQAEAAEAVQKALQADFSADPATTRYNAAASAMDAYNQGLQAQKDAADGVAQANRSLKASEEAVNEARRQAVQRIKDVQRALRDAPLDERQAKLNAKQAQENLDKLLANGGTADQVEQARIDQERSRNALQDLQQDKGPKRDALNTELGKGVEGNKQLVAAIQQNKDAQKAVGAANRTLAEASARVSDLRIAYLTAIGGMKMTEKQWEAFHKKVEAAKKTTIEIALNTKGAENQLRTLLQGRYALQLMDKYPDLTLEQAMARAAKALPTTVSADAKNDAATLNRQDYPKGSTGYAEGGPTVAVPTVASPTVAGPVYGPGTGTSDNIAVHLPVGGPAAVSPGEHIVTDGEVKAAPGGHAYLEAFRAALRARRPWTPEPVSAGYRAPTPRPWSLPIAAPRLATALPAYAGGGAVAAAARTDVAPRQLIMHVGTINNPVAEPASTSLYRQTRRLVEGDDRW